MQAHSACAQALNGRGTDNMTSPASVIAAAGETCRQRGLKLTPIRRRVLEIVAGSPIPISAYAIIYCLSDTKPVGPPTVYRALEFLVRAGLVHHLRLRKAYICDARPGEDRFAALFTCIVFGRVTESASEPLRQSIVKLAAAAGFEPHVRTVEAEGRCAACRGSFRTGTSR